jgi:[lysine-biosynthesis-protein LysW]--L-2-aminoadipate ligase
MNALPRVGIVYGRLRVEERLLAAAFERRGVACDLIDERRVILRPDDRWERYDVVLARNVSQLHAVHTVTMLEAIGIPVINPLDVLECCNDKVRTSAALSRAGIPQPRYHVAFSPNAVLEAIEEIGYPAVLKPPVGSWGRLLARVNDRDAAEALIEHKLTLGSFHHGSFYVQEYVPKEGRDIRAFAIDGRAICAIYRNSEHWVTNTARGAVATNCPLTPQLEDLCERVSQAVGGGLLAIDVFEHPERGLLVNEVNATIEFRNSIAPTGVDIPAAIVDHALALARDTAPCLVEVA